jgi:hypothetical protein
VRFPPFADIRSVADIGISLHCPDMRGLPVKPAERVLLFVLIVIAGGWYWYGRTHGPSVAIVNGTYRSECCGTVVLANGWIITDSGRTRFDLEDMKFGLTGYPERSIRVDGRQVVMGPPSTYATGIGFSADRKAFTLCPASPRCDPEYRFSRVDWPAAALRPGTSSR